MDLYIVRHGLTEWNTEGRLQGQTDVPLCEAGREQARALRERLLVVPFAAAYSSDLSRARETAEIVLEGRGVPLTTTAALREISVGPWEGRTYAELRAEAPELLQRWVEDPASCRFEGAEPLTDAGARVGQAIETLCGRHEREPVLVVGHGTSLRAWLCGALGMPLGNLRRLWLEATSVTELRWEQGRFTLRRLGDIGHLPGLERWE